MELFDVYPLFDITPVKGEGTYVFDKDGKKYQNDITKSKKTE